MFYYVNVKDREGKVDPGTVFYVFPTIVIANVILDDPYACYLVALKLYITNLERHA